jgi:ABC-2 type transport system ATP-binding protein
MTGQGGGVVGDLAVEVRGLVKRYGRGVTAVDRLDLSIARGETYGLLGPNGAGKTTTMRMLLGLVRPTSGTVRVFGLRPGEPGCLRRLGAMGEAAFHPFLSGRDNARAAARRAGVGDRRVDEVLSVVALSARARDRFCTYSLGMKQRLGVAVALLKDPDLLVLDEPSNGLDPIGQREMRRLIGDLGREGRTIVLSSHDLDEVERLCGRVGVIGGGRMLAEGSPERLRGEPMVFVRALPAPDAVRVAAAAPGVTAVREAGAELCLEMRDAGPAAVAAVACRMLDAGLDVTGIRVGRRSLEEAFLELTGGRTGGADSVRSAGVAGAGS